LALGLFFSILNSGSRPCVGAFGGLGGFGGLLGSSIVSTSVVFQLNGGMCCRMPATISSRIDSSTKRHQGMLTSQPA
jgi:hypothetical protein